MERIETNLESYPDATGLYWITLAISTGRGETSQSINKPNKCVSAANNAGLAFDHTYTKYYPLLYRVYEGCGKDLKCTAQRIMAAPRKRHERDLLAYFERLE